MSWSHHVIQVKKISLALLRCFHIKPFRISRLTHGTLKLCMFLHISVESLQCVTLRSVQVQSFHYTTHACNNHIHHVTGEPDKILIKDQYMIRYCKIATECNQSIKLSGWLWRMVCVL